MSLPSEELRARLSPEKRKLHDWLYEWTRDGRRSTLLVACMEALSVDHTEWSFF